MNVPCGKVNSLSDCFNGQLSKQLGLIQETDEVKYVRSPIRHDGEKAKNSRPPKLNEHGRSIMRDLDFSEGEIDKFFEGK